MSNKSWMRVAEYDANFRSVARSTSHYNSENNKCDYTEEQYYYRRTNYYTSAWAVTSNENGRLNSKLLDAVAKQNIEKVEKLLLRGANANATCRFAKISACHAAACYITDILQLLIQHKVKTKREDENGRTPLHFAAWAGNTRNIALLLALPEDIQAKMDAKMDVDTEKEVQELRPDFRFEIDAPCKSLTHYTSNLGLWKDSIGHKCKKYMDDVPKFFSGWTPLHVASVAAHADATRLLLAAGANPNSRDALERTPLDIVGGMIKVDEEKYVETVKTLIEYGGKLNWVPDSLKLDSALHIAVMLQSEDAIKLLLAEGAPITYHNSRGNTPLHECVLNMYETPLQILANHIRRYSTSRIMDVTDSLGYTVLHKAILLSWLPGVRIALRAGADVTKAAVVENTYTAIHLAALKGDVKILNEIINAATYVNFVIDHNENIEQPLLCAIRSGNLDCVRAIVDAGAPLVITTFFDTNHDDTAPSTFCSVNFYQETEFNMILHATAGVSNKEILEFLLDNFNYLNKFLLYRCPNLKNMTPVEFAAFHHKIDNFTFLLGKMVDQAHRTGNTYDPSTLLDIVATLGYKDMFTEIINVIPDAVQIATVRGHYPLHNAIKACNKDMVMELIINGADLAHMDESGATAVSLIIEHISQPTEFINNIFDSHIKINNVPIHDPMCEITVDYSLLMPTHTLKEEGQMRVLKAILETGTKKNQRKLLVHPLVESFLKLKWKTLSTLFYVIFFLHICFVVSMSIYIVSVFYHKDRNDVANYFNPVIWQFLVLLTIVPVVIQEISCCDLQDNNWLLQVSSIELWVKIATYGLSAVMPMIVYKESNDVEWQRHVASLTLMLILFNIMLLLSRTPMSGYYIQMFWKVSIKVTKILSTFLCLIIMFSFCFMIQFHNQEPFKGPWPAFVKTLVMMTSEFEYDDTFKDETSKKSVPIPNQILRVMFVIFLVLAAIVLMNLMIGVAVNDVQELVQDGKLRRLEKQVYFLKNIERTRIGKTLYSALRLSQMMQWENVPHLIKIKPMKNNKHCLSRRIMTSILKKAQLQYDNKANNAATIKNDTRMEEILQAIEKKEQKVLEIESKYDNANAVKQDVEVQSAITWTNYAKNIFDAIQLAFIKGSLDYHTSIVYETEILLKDPCHPCWEI